MNTLKVFTAFSGYDSQCMALDRLGEEKWADIVGLEGLYQVSSFGRIKRLPGYRKSCRGSKSYLKEKILRPHKDKDGYYIISLRNRGKTYKIHRLVAQAFIPNPNNFPQINHKDENKENNMVENLEWCTSKYNNNYGSHLVRSGLKHRKAVIMLDLHNVVLNKFLSIKEAENFIGIKGASTMIVRCCKNTNKTAYGYKWRYDHV